MRENGFSITNKTKSTLPRVSFVNIKNIVLGKNYSLSLVFIGERKSAELNLSYRNKNKPTNILSFPLDKKTPVCAGRGEIFITQKVAKKEAVLFNRKPDNFIVFLFIHGLLHLKGMEHGSRMERAEAKLCKQFRV
jgi:probable rRNA maturation factor